MQFPGTDALTDRLSPTSLAARKRQLAQQLAGGRSGNAVVGGAGYGLPGAAGGGYGFPGALGGGMAFASSLFGNTPAASGAFFGRNGTPTNTAPGNIFQGHNPSSVTAGQVSTGDPLASGGAAVPSTGFVAESPIVGGHSPTSGIDPSWIQALAQLYMSAPSGSSMKAF